jgi:putative phosphoesterase
MIIGVISDTHGSAAAVRRAVSAAGPVDYWLHAGDYSQDANLLAEIAKVPVTAVAGNCDGQTNAKVDEFIELAGKKLWLTHGHRYNARQRTAELAWWGRQYDVDAVIYGHTHVPTIIEQDGLVIFNPGSPYQPRQGSEPSCGLLEIDATGSLTARLVSVPRAR